MSTLAEKVQLAGTVAEIGLPLIKSLWELIASSVGASKERSESIKRRLVATAKALIDSAEEAHNVHDSEHAETVEALKLALARQKQEGSGQEG